MALISETGQQIEMNFKPTEFKKKLGKLFQWRIYNDMKIVKGGIDMVENWIRCVKKEDLKEDKF